MKNKFYLTTFLLFATLILACKKSDDDVTVKKDPVIINLNTKSQKLVNSSGNFGFNLFTKIAAVQEEKNWMISPLSVSLALAMTYNGADNETKTEMQNTLGFNDLTTEEINSNLQNLTDELLGVDEKVILSIANSIWYRETFSVLPDFISTNENYYNAEVAALDFSDSGAKDIINSWVSDNTNHKIETIIDQINPDDVMFLINAIYFKGTWKYKFDKSDNYNHNFTYEDGTNQQVEMMKQSTDLKISFNEDFTMVELPYGQGNWAMDLILPADDNTTADIIQLFNQENWTSWVDGLNEPMGTDISLPPFKFEFEEKLNNMLIEMGMPKAFDPFLADFSKINGLIGLYISEVKHKTFIEVNEEGTEAAAVTSVGVSVTSTGGSGGNYTVVFDKPFLFVIREITTGTILFIGKIGNPIR